VRHLQSFPNDGLVHALENVFAFDSADQRVREQLIETFLKHGIPVFLFDSEMNNNDGFKISLAKQNEVEQRQMNFERIEILKHDDEKNLQFLSLENSIKIKSLAKWKIEESNKTIIRGKTIGRLQKFTELKSKWNIEIGVCISMCTMNGKEKKKKTEI